MNMTMALRDQTYGFNSEQFHDISIPLDFHGAQPRAFGVEKASARAYAAGDFVGDTRLGGSCNFEQLALVPHCNGTHTEGVGHISHTRIGVLKVVSEVLIPATLITVEPKRSENCEGQYIPEPEKGDRLITGKMLKEALIDRIPEFSRALVVRTLPNDPIKMHSDYSQKNPPYFTMDAIAFLVDQGVQHLLVDLPSIDRSADQGHMSSHHLFWGVEQGTHELEPTMVSHRSITEMIFVDSKIPDGQYLLNLQVAPFVSDASPSRPILYPVKQISN